MPAVKKTRTRVSRKSNSSDLSSFLERPLPGADEVKLFEEAIKKEVISEETDSNLSAIYHDNRGNLVDVSKVKKRSRLRLIVLFKKLFVLTIIACAVYGAYYYYFQRPAGTDGIIFKVVAPEESLVGAPVTYEIDYKNASGLALSGVKIEAVLPSGFVLKDSVPAASGINSWYLGNVDIGESDKILINGYLVGTVDSANVILARMSYTPANFSSEFKKEASANTVISGMGFNVGTDYLNMALIGQNNELKLSFSGFKDNQLANFYLEVSGSDNFKISRVGNEVQVVSSSTKDIKVNASSTPIIGDIQAAGDGRWLISNIPTSSDERIIVPVVFGLNSKNNDNEDLTVRLIQKEVDGSERIFWEKTVSFEIMKSDLNISLSLNEEKSDKPLDFGSTMNYSLSYSNNGDSTLYDLVLMVVIKGDFVQWTSLRDPLSGSVSGGAIVWTKEELPALAELAPGSHGNIDFSLKVKDFSENDLGRDTVISSYAQYGLNNSKNNNDDNKSNTIKSQINSDLSLTEKILYFNEDNIPLGSGPLPPRVNEKTTVRVMWTIKNNLHDLEDVNVRFNLPSGVVWAQGGNTNVGSIAYNESDNSVTWHLGFLPLSVYRADAEFNISLTPSESDRNRIMVLSSGGIATALDSFTQAPLQIKTTAKTTKLEDDEIAGLSNSGRVE